MAKGFKRYSRNTHKEPNTKYGRKVPHMATGGRTGGFFRSYQKHCRKLGIPELALRDLETAKAIGEQLLKELDDLEVALTAFEEEFPDLAKQMPWYEEREEYKRLKALGTAPRATWWQALAALDTARVQTNNVGFEYGKVIASMRKNPNFKLKK